MDNPILLSYKETADHLNVSHRSIQRWVSKGYIPVVRFSKRTVKISIEKLNLLIESGGIKILTKEVVHEN